MRLGSIEQRQSFGAMQKKGVETPSPAGQAQFDHRAVVAGALLDVEEPLFFDAVGVYDPGFRMGYEDVDYCLRVFTAGFTCRYEPAVSAIHHESLFRSRPDAKQQQWHDLSIARLREKWSHLPVAELVGGM